MTGGFTAFKVACVSPGAARILSDREGLRTSAPRMKSETWYDLYVNIILVLHIYIIYILFADIFFYFSGCVPLSYLGNGLAKGRATICLGWLLS